jgi:hypothetical protein
MALTRPVMRQMLRVSCDSSERSCGGVGLSFGSFASKLISSVPSGDPARCGVSGGSISTAAIAAVGLGLPKAGSPSTAWKSVTPSPHKSVAG